MKFDGSHSCVEAPLPEPAEARSSSDSLRSCAGVTKYERRPFSSAWAGYCACFTGNKWAAVTVPSPSFGILPFVLDGLSLKQPSTLSRQLRWRDELVVELVHEGFVVVGSCRLEGLGHGYVCMGSYLTQPFWGSLVSLVSDEQLDRELRTARPKRTRGRRFLLPKASAAALVHHGEPLSVYCGQAFQACSRLLTVLLCPVRRVVLGRQAWPLTGAAILACLNATILSQAWPSRHSRAALR